VCSSDLSVLDGKEIAAALEWCRQNEIACLYYLADPADPANIRRAEINGFMLTDIRMVLECAQICQPPSRRAPKAVRIRKFRQSDLPELKKLARIIHTNTRFYNDHRFSRAQGASLYEAWIEKCCRDAKTAVFTAEYGRAIVGYLACRMQKGRTGSIVLAGVDTNARNKGVGTALVIRSLEWFYQQGARLATVVTQGANIQALRLYTSWGFLPRETKLWYHRWFDS
jgi:ribosomal protein S18 acetylase RimI-like enzyme